MVVDFARFDGGSVGAGDNEDILVGKEGDFCVGEFDGNVHVHWAFALNILSLFAGVVHEFCDAIVVEVGHLYERG